MNLKVNLGIAIQNPLNGYMNIDPVGNPQNQNVISAPIDQLDSLLDHNSVSFLLAIDVLDYFPLQVKNQILK